MARSKRPENDDLYEYGLDVPKRRVYLNGDIDRDSVMQAIKGLSILARLSESEPIQLVINSEGGDMIQGFALINYIRSLPNEVTGIVLGTCESAAVVILQACKHRAAMPEATLMTHRGTRSTEFDVEVDNRADQLIASRMGWTKQRLDKFHSHDRYMFAEEAMKLGLIDEVLTHDDK